MAVDNSIIKAYGIVPIYVTEDTSKEYLIVQNHDGYWGFPKGGANNNESSKEAAVRELLEETGIKVAVNDLKESIDYEYSMTAPEGTKNKKVYLFPVFVKNKDVELQNEELQQYKWTEIDEAVALIKLDSLTRKLEAIDGNKQ